MAPSSPSSSQHHDLLRRIMTTLLRVPPISLLPRLPTTLTHTTNSLPRPSLTDLLRTLLFILALLNLKSLPFAWHIRLFTRFFRHLSTASTVTTALHHHRTHPDSVHPIFAPVSIYMRAPLLEGDYNMHKSNSTYFSDLDQSRGALVSRLLGAAMRRKDGKEQGNKEQGRVNVILGSVHCSFHKEVRLYERYECRSRVLGWDRKWLVIGTWFVRAGGKQEVLLASAVSKYVFKRGRLTVSPERALERAGWWPERGLEEGVGMEASGVLVEGGRTEAEGSPSPVKGGVIAGVPDVAVVEVGERLERVVSGMRGKDVVAEAARTPEGGEGVWDWERIQQERARGMKLVEAWLALDGDLRGEYEYGLR